MTTADARDLTTSEHISESIWDVYRRGSEFFMREGDVHDTLRRLAKLLGDAGIDYAVVGGMALVAYGYRRFTEDVDILLTSQGLRDFRAQFVGRGYLPAFSSATKSFRDTRTGIKIEVLTTGEFPGDGKPKPVAFPDPAAARLDREGLWVLSLDKLIELKLASGLSAAHRLKDLSDVQDLIVALDLSRDFAERLDASVRAEYERLWELAQHADQGPHERA